MDDLRDLEQQLAQLETLLAVAGDEDKAGILSLIEDLQALLKSSSAVVGDHDLSLSGSTNHTAIPASPSLEDEEYLRFQEELRSLTSGEGSKEDDLSNPNRSSISDEREETSDTGQVSTEFDTNTNIEDELSALVGMKCKAPFMQNWGQIGFYNAFVSAVEPLNLESKDQISVSVIFTQPVSEKMRACPYFLSGTCKFEEGCKFSHGEVIPLSHLRDYKEPDFSTLATGSRVLAKYSDELWYRAVISRITESGDCDISYENYPDKVTIPLHDTLPLYDDEGGSEVSSGSDDGNSSDSDEAASENEDSADPSPIVWVHMRGTSALGLWEQHTRGIGSKLMAKMGYVFGSGLGKNGEGRVEPVDAVILPPGRSLDTVMKLREKAGGSANLFSAERHMRRLQRKKKEQDAKLDSKLHQSQSMFNFLNDQLNLRKETKRPHQLPLSTAGPTTHKESSVSLSKQLLTVGDRIRQVTRDITKCRESVKRHEGRDQITVDAMSRKLTNLEAHLSELKKSEIKISNEQQHRSDKKKLTIF